MKEKILNLLENIEYLHNISFDNKMLYKDISYNLIFNATRTYKKIEIKLKICIPKDWDRKLIDIYVVNFMEIPYIPHLEYKRKTLFIPIRGYSY